MATVREVIVPTEKKKDGTWNVKIRVNHKAKTLYLKTHHFVTDKQIRKDFTIKDSIILDLIYPVLKEYRIKISELGPKLELLEVSRLVIILTKKEQTADDINIIEYGKKRIEELKKAKRNASAANMTTIVYSLMDYFKIDFVPVTEIRTKMLHDYEKYLRSTRTISRPDQFNNVYKRTVNGLSDTGLHNHMRDLRILFNDVKDFYNDEDLDVIVIKHYPFKKYKLVNVTENLKPKLTIDQVIAIRDCEVPENSRIELAKDLFMLSLYLCGMNAVDLYQLEAEIFLNERVDYNRSKTKSRRRDRAFISVNIPDIAIPYFVKYAGHLQLRYATHLSLDRALSVGMRSIGKDLNIADLEFYDARHAFGDWARNICRFSKDDVALALNHKDQTTSVTDIYISKNWKIIDEIQESVINLLSAENEHLVD
ncbi:phage integrase SAM-like domain-containing protein [Mucilaginibacter sp. UYCu711]|uniref:phage integrase SAM-like domain-containing protein n=1 Tax=Mucilaginibacter sp. UYCu711 TaxID=3156339 RepID=UPI003D19CC6C